MGNNESNYLELLKNSELLKSSSQDLNSKTTSLKQTVESINNKVVSSVENFDNIKRMFELIKSKKLKLQTEYDDYKKNIETFISENKKVKTSLNNKKDDVLNQKKQCKNKLDQKINEINNRLTSNSALIDTYFEILRKKQEEIKGIIESKRLYFENLGVQLYGNNLDLNVASFNYSNFKQEIKNNFETYQQNSLMSLRGFESIIFRL